MTSAMKHTRKRGSTLAEMVIVMAVLAIMTAMVVSFSSICGAWTRLGIYRYNLQNEERFMRTLISTYIAARDEAGYRFRTDPSGTQLYCDDISGASEDSEVIRYDAGTHQMLYGPSDNPVSYTFEFAEKIDFSVWSKTDGGQLIYCHVYYTPPPLNGRQASQQTFIIMVAARSAGQTVEQVVGD